MVLLAALARGETQLENVLDSEDVAVMVAALRGMGVGIEGDLDGVQEIGANRAWVRGVIGAGFSC